MTVRQRIVAGTAATLSWQAVDQKGEPADPGTTTVAVSTSAGSVVHAAGTATTVAATARTIAIPAQSVDELTVTWTGATATETTTVDVVGGVLFTVAELRAAQLGANQPNVTSTADYPTATILAVRQEVETLFEQRCRTAFVPRFVVLTTTSQGTAAQTGIRSLRWVELTDGTFITDAATIDTYATVTQRGVTCSAAVHRVGAVIGFERAPADVARVGMLYARHLLTMGQTGIDLRAQYTPGGVDGMGIAIPGKPWYITGIDEVDEVLRAYRHRSGPRSVRVGWLT